jgi:hypothetical protein
MIFNASAILRPFTPTVLVLFLCWVTPAMGQRWRMLSEDQTAGLTLLWQLPPEKLQAMVGPGQKPRIQNGKGTLMLFLAYTNQSYLDSISEGPVSIAHLLIPLENSVAMPATILRGNTQLGNKLKKFGFRVQTGEINLIITEDGGQMAVKGSVRTREGEIKISGAAPYKKGAFRDLPNTRLTRRRENKRFLEGPESYSPIPISDVKIEQTGQNWLSRYSLDAPPDRIWVNVDFSVDFKFTK